MGGNRAAEFLQPRRPARRAVSHRRSVQIRKAGRAILCRAICRGTPWDWSRPCEMNDAPAKRLKWCDGLSLVLGAFPTFGFELWPADFIFRTMNNAPILQLDLHGIKKIRSGKVREVFDLGDRFLLVASDRISAFDVIMPNGIPRKGEVLTQISHFWFEKFSTLVPNHLLRRANEPLGVPALAGLPAAQLAN